jgi:deoxyhypusine synthase
MRKYLTDPTEPFRINPQTNIKEMLEQMSKISFQGSNLAKTYKIYKAMLKEKTFIFLGLSGAMVPAGMRRIISYLIGKRYLDCIVTTGANIFHDICEALGYHHYLGTNVCNDQELFKHHIDRIYDTFASETEFIVTDNFVSDFGETLLDKLYTTREFFYLLGKYIIKYQKSKGLKITDSIVVSAAKYKLPIYCAALGDSSIGIALAELFYHKKKK